MLQGEFSEKHINYYGNMNFMRHAINIIMKNLLFLLLICCWNCNNQNADGYENYNFTNPIKYKQLKAKAALAKRHCKQNKMDTTIAILIDMSIHSGLKRFVVWDFKKDTIVALGMVSHGCGTKKWASDASKFKPVFSNENDSHCSSLGKYKIGERAYSQWGIHIKYLLHGLESTNSNALARTVVLHSWEAIPDDATYPAGISESWGCPAVSNVFMKKIDRMLKVKKRPVLLWIYQ